MISVAASNGEVVLQTTGIPINQYTLLTDNQERNKLPPAPLDGR